MRRRACARPARCIIVSAKSFPPSDPPPPHGGYGATSLTRRELLGAAVALPLWRAVGAAQPPRPGLAGIRNARCYATTDSAAGGITIDREWSGDICRSRVVNSGRAPVR